MIKSFKNILAISLSLAVILCGLFSFTAIAEEGYDDDVVMVTNETEPYAYNDTTITKAFITDEVTHLRSDMFKNCENLIAVYGGENVTSIGEDAFNGCKNLETVPGFTKLETTGDKAFYNCHKLTTFNIPSTMKEIGNECFVNCYALKGDVVIPDSVTKLGDYCFRNCKSLTSAHIGAKIESLIRNFDYCTGITSFSVSPANPRFCAVDGVIYDKDKRFCQQYPLGNTAKTYTVPNGTEALHYCFDGPKYLETLIVPKSVTGMRIDDAGSIKTINFCGTKAYWDTKIAHEMGAYTGNIVFNYSAGGSVQQSNTSSKPAVTQNTSSKQETTSSDAEYTSSQETLVPKPSVSVQKLFATENGVRIIAVDTVFSYDTSFTVKNIKENKQVKNIEKALKRDYGNFVAFDISATQNNETVQPKGDVYLSFDIPSGFDPNDIIVLHISSDNKVEELETKLSAEKDAIIAITNHFSTFVIAEKLTTPQRSYITEYIVISVGIVAIIVVLTIFFVRKKKKN